jgi:hypothetical protein
MPLDRNLFRRISRAVYVTGIFKTTEFKYETETPTVIQSGGILLGVQLPHFRVYVCFRRFSGYKHTDSGNTQSPSLMVEMYSD